MTKNVNSEDVKYALDILKKTQNYGSTPKQMKGFVWPEYKTEKERIAAMSTKYKDKTIQEAFAAEYKIKFSRSFLNNSHDDEYLDPQPGEIISLRIKDINKKGVVFYQGNVKESIICNTNLYQYPRLREYFPEMKAISCKVISRSVNEIIVDPLAGMLDEWIKQHVENLQDQYNIEEERCIQVSSLHLVRGGFTGRVRVDSISDFCGKDMFIEAFIPGSQIVLNVEYDFESWEGKTVDAFITNYTTKPGSTNMTLICSAKEHLRHLGNINIINWFKSYCDDGDQWNYISRFIFDGVVTGVCHTQNKCGAFVEIPNMHITAMIPLRPDQLCRYTRGMNLRVKIDHFDEPTRWNGLQMIHIAPYTIEDNILKNMSLRLNLKEATQEDIDNSSNNEPGMK